MPLGKDVGLGLGDIVLDGDPAPPRKWYSTPLPHFGRCLFRPVYCGQTVAHLSIC